jgi:O-Antigen ligase
MINKNNFAALRLSDAATWTALFAGVYLAVLPMADTIAVRNLALLGLLVWFVMRFPEIRTKVSADFVILLWAAYLLVFPFFASDTHTAWNSLGGQWGRGLLAMIAGVGAAVLLRGRVLGNIFYLALASAVPLLVHLVFFFVHALETRSIPWGYWGRESHHADLGYAACQVVVLAVASWLAGERRYRMGAMALVVVSVLSTALAQSRAGLVFALLSGCFIFATYQVQHVAQLKRHVLVLLVAAVAGLAGLSLMVDARWHTLADKLAAGLLGDALQIECQGTASIEAQIYATNGPGSRSEDVVNAVRDGDGSRVVLLRAGLKLALMHPMGSDGSRQAFMKLLRQECPQPMLTMAHTHNGWIDTMLAIGWLGAGLYFATLLYLLRLGVQVTKKHPIDQAWGLALTALSLFWLLRGFTDSVFRDHMLEMQGFVLMFAATAARMLEYPAHKSGK